MDNTLKQGPESLPDWFLGTPVGQKLAAEARQRKRQERRRTIEAIHKLKADRERSAPALAAALAQAQMKVEEARRRVYELEEKASESFCDSYSASIRFDHELGRLELELRSSASKEIQVFIDQLEELATATRKGLRLVELPGQKNPISDTRRRVVITNADSINERLAAIRAARDAAEQLKLEEPDDLNAEIERLRASIPQIEGLERTA